MIQPSHGQLQLTQAMIRKKTGYADLHMHTVLSDGDFTVEQVLQIAAAKGLRAISITDHDNIDSWTLGKSLAQELDIELIPGVEISAVHQGRDIHILGYFFDVTNLALNMELEQQVRRRQARVRSILRKLNTFGIDLSWEKVTSYCAGRIIGRPHIAAALVEEEYVRNFSQAFNEYLGEDGKAFVEKKGISPQQAIRLIEKSGGVAVLAHPYKSHADDIIDELVEAGLKGIETWCQAQKGSTRRRYRDIARKHNLLGTGGSDFHNDNSQCAIGGLKMPYQVVEAMKEIREQAKSDWF